MMDIESDRTEDDVVEMPEEPPAKAWALQRIAVAALVLASCAVLAAVEFYAARPKGALVSAEDPMLAKIDDAVGFSYGGGACCVGGCHKCLNCGDTAEQRLDQEQCSAVNGAAWCSCSCSSVGGGCSSSKK